MCNFTQGLQGQAKPGTIHRNAVTAGHVPLAPMLASETGSFCILERLYKEVRGFTATGTLLQPLSLLAGR